MVRSQIDAGLRAGVLVLPEGHWVKDFRDGDPYIQRGMAQYELIPWAVGIGKDDLDKIAGA